MDDLENNAQARDKDFAVAEMLKKSIGASVPTRNCPYWNAFELLSTEINNNNNNNNSVITYI